MLRTGKSSAEIVAMYITAEHVVGLASLVFLPVALFLPKGVAVVFAVTVLGVAAGTIAKPESWGGMRSELAIAVGAFILWALLSAAWSLTPGESMKTGISAGATLLGGLLLVHAVNASGRDVLERYLIQGGMLGFGMLAVELVAGYPVTRALSAAVGRPFMRPEAAVFFLNPGLALAALFAWPWLLALWRRRLPLLALAAAGAIAVVLALGDADAPVVGFGVGCVAFVGALLWPRAVRWIIGAVVVIGTLGAPIVPAVLPPVADLVKAAPNLSPSLYHRVSIWQVTLGHIKEKPVLGQGFDTARALYGKETKKERTLYDNEGIARWTSGYEPIPLHPHNAFLQVWLELGAIGALIGGALVLAVVRAIGRLRHACLDQAVATAAFATGLFLAAVSFGIWQSWWLCGLWLVGAFTAAVVKRIRHPTEM